MDAVIDMRRATAGRVKVNCNEAGVFVVVECDDSQVVLQMTDMWFGIVAEEMYHAWKRGGCDRWVSTRTE